MVVWLPHRLKSTILKFFIHSVAYLFRASSFKEISKTVDFSLWAEKSMASLNYTSFWIFLARCVYFSAICFKLIFFNFISGYRYLAQGNLERQYMHDFIRYEMLRKEYLNQTFNFMPGVQEVCTHTIFSLLKPTVY